jgi:hypothetical protein
MEITVENFQEKFDTIAKSIRTAEFIAFDTEFTGCKTGLADKCHEYDSLEEGTKAVANALVELTKKGGTTIIGGGDSVAALEKFGIAKEKLTHVSTGGGASLEFLEGQVLPGLACLDGYDADSSNNANSSVKKSFAEELKRVSA